MRGILGAAAYLPPYTDGVRRLAAFDEDAFTLAATALERLTDRGAADHRTQTVRIVGSEPAWDGPMLSAVLGAPVVLPSAPPRSLAEAIDQAGASGAPEWIVVVELADGPGPKEHLPPPGEGSVALRVDEAPAAYPLATLQDRLGRSAAADRPLRALFDLARSQRFAPAWVGDWSADPSDGRPTPSSSPRSRLGTPPWTVSEGALVPGPREEEARSSRWRFLADRCGSCGARTFPARGRCGSCGGTDRLAPMPLPIDGGRVVASTWIGPGGQPTEFDLLVDAAGPYGVVLVEVAEGLRATLAVSDASPEEVRVGARVDTRLRRLYPMEGRWRYGRKAVPALPAPPLASPSGPA